MTYKGFGDRKGSEFAIFSQGNFGFVPEALDRSGKGRLPTSSGQDTACDPPCPNHLIGSKAPYALKIPTRRAENYRHHVIYPMNQAAKHPQVRLPRSQPT